MESVNKIFRTLNNELNSYAKSMQAVNDNVVVEIENINFINRKITARISMEVKFNYHTDRMNYKISITHLFDDEFDYDVELINGETVYRDDKGYEVSVVPINGLN